MPARDRDSLFVDYQQIDELAGGEGRLDKTPADALAPTMAPTPGRSVSSPDAESLVGGSIRYRSDFLCGLLK